MARAKNNGDGRLAEALATLALAQTSLVHAQATLAQNQTAFLARIAEMDQLSSARQAESDRRFARIEAILIEHSRILHALPDAIRDKIGFKQPEPRPAG